VVARHPRGFFRIQDGRNSESKSTNDNNFQQNGTVTVEKYVFKGKQSNCYVTILFGDPLDERIQDGRQNI